MYARLLPHQEDEKLLACRRTKKLAGGTTALARRLGISKQAVSMWGRIPAERVIAIEAATGIPREELRPDLYPPRVERRRGP
jgi:DNA-binding transcriptional regulator YdaS (Cro superfamily)